MFQCYLMEMFNDAVRLASHRLTLEGS